MQKKFIRNLIWIQWLNWSVKPIWILGIETLVQNRLGEALYGSYFVVFNFSLLFTIVLDFGMNSYITRELASGAGTSALWRSSLRLKSLFSLLYLVLAFGMGLLQGLNPLLLGTVVLSQMLLQWLLFFRAYIQGMGRATVDAVFSVADRVFAILLVALVIWQGDMRGEAGLFRFAASQLLAYGLAAFLALAYVFNIIRLNHSPNIDQLNARVLWQKSAGFALLALLMVFFTRLDAVMMRMLLPDGEYHAGLYARGFRLLDAALIFPLLMSTLLLPAFSSKESERPDAVKALQDSSVRIMLMVAVPAATLAWLYGKDVLLMLNPGGEANEISATATILGCLMSAYIPMCLVFVYGTWLTAKRKLRLLNRLAASALVLNFVLNIWLIPMYEGRGAAVSVLITQAYFGLGCVLAARFTPVSVWLKMGLQLLFALCCAIAFAYLTHGVLHWTLSALFSGVVMVLCLLLNGFLPFRKVLNTFRPQSK